MAHIETGGTDARCKPSSPCFLAGGNGVTINTTDMRNPYSAIQSGKLADEIPAVIRFMKTVSPKHAKKWNDKVERGLRALNDGKPLRVQCAHGKHRSVALAEEISRRYTHEHACSLDVVHLDRK